MRTKSLSPVELLDSVLARADAVEPVINAFTERRDEEAHAAARDSEERYQRGEGIRALEGLPLGLKEEEPVEGWRMRYGSLAVDEIAKETSPFTERMLDSGAVIHARTTTPEFSCAAYTHTKLWGITRNPWSTDWCVGGSSGGSGASLAAGSSTLASGSDIGGSIRVPASANGVVGFKPPHGRVPVSAPFNLDRYCHSGPMARTIADTVVFQNAIAGQHPRDITTLHPKLELPWPADGVTGMRVALSIDLGGWDVDPEIQTNTRALAKDLEQAGAFVDEVEIPWSFEHVVATTRKHYAAIFGAEIARAAEAFGDQLCDYTLEWAKEVANSSHGDFLVGLEGEQAMWEPLGELFRTYDVLLCPTWASTGLRAGDSYIGVLLENGGGNDRQFTAFMTSPFNALSTCPVLAVPSGFASNGVPTGVQIVGRPYHDEDVFRVGAAVEQVRPWPQLAPL
jgi:Asp-tRNA(Asn)/Glu-tRNA(Gln) amidotransferase A subunit family amidase